MTSQISKVNIKSGVPGKEGIQEAYPQLYTIVHKKNINCGLKQPKFK